MTRFYYFPVTPCKRNKSSNLLACMETNPYIGGKQFVLYILEPECACRAMTARIPAGYRYAGSQYTNAPEAYAHIRQREGELVAPDGKTCIKCA